MIAAASAASLRRPLTGEPLRRSYLPLLRATEQPFGAEQDDDEEEHQRDAFLVRRRNVEADQVLHDADEHAAEQRPARLVEAADDRGEEGLEADRIAHVE